MGCLYNKLSISKPHKSLILSVSYIACKRKIKYTGSELGTLRRTSFDLELINLYFKLKLRPSRTSKFKPVI